MSEVFDYEASIWGAGEATLRPSDPTSFRLQCSLETVKDLPQGARVLEVGTGGGQFIRAIKRLVPRLACLGSDISEQAIARAKKHKDGVEYALSTPQRQPYSDASIDAVLVLDVVEHVENPDEFLREIFRVLKPGGVLYCFVPCEGDVLSLWNVLDRLGLKKNLTRRFAGHINYFSRTTLTRMFERVGFSVVKVRYSEHLLGQLLGIVAFCLMARRAARGNGQQLNNEAYFTELGQKSRGMSGLFKGIKKCVNSLVYFESKLLARVPSPNVHTFLKKP